ncbi:C40 family peptidase [Gordonia sp. CPCC 205515]|uniref:C40 family peptidase n=1 Tax=Gordonia sp. CPCC 205515 TaxID=3140791 RepID=UPI003AF3CB01
MIPVALLLAPLHALLQAFGTGSMPFHGPSTQLRDASDVLDGVRAQSARSTLELDQHWNSPAAAQVVSTMSTAHTDTGHVSDRGNHIAAVTDTASELISGGYTDLGGVIDSFVESVNASPMVLTPAGFPALIQLAENHLQRADTIIKRVRHDLAGETRKLQKVADEQAAEQRQFTKRHKEATGLARSVASSSKGSEAGKGIAAQSITSKNLPGGGVQLTLPNGKVVTAPNEKAANAVRAALTQRGVPYVWGGTTPGKGLDCSGLTQYSYRQAGVEIPRTAENQAVGERVPDGQAQAGDLVVWSGHVAMALGDGTLIEAGDPVDISPMRTDNIGMQYMGVYRPTAGGTANAA